METPHCPFARIFPIFNGALSEHSGRVFEPLLYSGKNVNKYGGGGGKGALLDRRRVQCDIL